MEVNTSGHPNCGKMQYNEWFAEFGKFFKDPGYAVHERCAVWDKNALQARNSRLFVRNVTIR